MFALLTLGAVSLRAQMDIVHPQDMPGPLSNPLMGFRPDLNGYSQYPYPTLVRDYIRWNQIENSESDTVQKIRDFCNARWANLPAANVKVIPRIYIDWDKNAGNEYWPADLQSGDWSSQQFKDRVIRLVARLGQVWDDDPRVAWVQTGIIGYWGEQENPVGIDQDGWGQRLGDAFTAAFKNKKLIVRNMGHWPGYQMGVYWDSFGHPGQRSGAWASIQSFNNQGRYLTQVVEGEVAYDWGTDVFDPVYGGEPSITLNDAHYTDNMIDVIRELHCSALGWIASYKLDGSFGTNPDNVRANAARMQKEFGYRFRLTEFSCPARTEPGADLSVQFKVRNDGSAPFYENWPVAVVLINESTRQIVWKSTLAGVDIRTWQPGSNYSYTSRDYQTPAQEHLITGSVSVPAGITPGEYLVGVTILEPMSQTPGVFFAVPNFFKQSQSQPLCRIGIGADAAGHALTGFAFDDLVNDDARFYTLPSDGPACSVMLQPSLNGSISLSPEGGSYVKGTRVQVTAQGKPGFSFTSWGGALAGSTSNPATIVMDADKTISANYGAVPTYRLSTRVANGSITLEPAGGVYNAGTKVTVTAHPESGYSFRSWGWDLSGSTNPQTITMDGDKRVTPNFAANVGETAGWLEDFALADGTRTDGLPTAWTATRFTGSFEVAGSRLVINGAGTEAVWESGDIEIKSGSIKASVEVQAAGGLDDAGTSMDYVRVYKIVDGGLPVLIGQEIKGGFAGTQTLVGTNITGSTLRLRIVALVTAADEYYYFDNVRVEGETAPPTCTLTTSSSNGSMTLNAAASGSGTLTYQWCHNGAYIPGATSASLTIPSVQAFHAGIYTVVVTSGGVSATSEGTVVTHSAPPASDARLLNLSTRALCQTGDGILIPGFYISGSGSKRLLMRVVGPELTDFKVPGALPDPQMVLKRQSDGAVQGSNDDWGDNANWQEIRDTTAALYAFALTPGSKSAALLMDLPAGGYTIVASGKGAATGVSIVELYEANGGAESARLVNISNRGFVGVGGNIMIPGFVVSDAGSRTFLIRAVGPTLSAFGVTGVLADPKIEVYKRRPGTATDDLILANDTWGENGDDSLVRETAIDVHAFALSEASKDAAFVVTLPPGAYTVNARGVGDSTGVALVEVYLAL